MSLTCNFSTEEKLPIKTTDQVGALQVNTLCSMNDGTHEVVTDRKLRPASKGKHRVKISVKDGMIKSLQRLK